MARKRRGGRRKGMLSQVGKKVGRVAATAMILAPVWVPAVLSYAPGLTGDQFLKNYAWNAFGMQNDNNINTTQLTTVAVRDAAFVGFGLLVRELAKRA